MHMNTPPVIACTQARNAAAILDIFNEAIQNSTALYDYQRSEEHTSELQSH